MPQAIGHVKTIKIKINSVLFLNVNDFTFDYKMCNILFMSKMCKHEQYGHVHILWEAVNFRDRYFEINEIVLN